MNKLATTVLAGILITGSTLAASAVPRTIKAETAGAIAGLGRACGPTKREPALDEFIRQSMVTIESRAKSAAEAQRGMSAFIGAFADTAFTRAKPARCAALTGQYEQVYHGLRAEYAGRDPAPNGN
jgi:hypothetical protein